MVPKLIQRNVKFYWYWYGLLKCWYHNNTNGSDKVLTSTMYFRQSVPAVFISFQTWDWLLLIGGLKGPASSGTWEHDLVNHSCIYKSLLTLYFKQTRHFCQIHITYTSNGLNIKSIPISQDLITAQIILLNTILQLVSFKQKLDRFLFLNTRNERFLPQKRGFVTGCVVVVVVVLIVVGGSKGKRFAVWWGCRSWLLPWYRA